MLLKLLKPIAGYSYFGGETATFPDEIAAALVNSGKAVVVQETEKGNMLPDDMPSRKLLFDNGFESISQILASENAISGISGISKTQAKKIIDFCRKHD